MNVGNASCVGAFPCVLMVKKRSYLSIQLVASITLFSYGLCPTLAKLLIWFYNVGIPCGESWQCN